MTIRQQNNLIFFLGGHDLEMVTIRDLLLEVAPDRFHDKGLPWGARASEYKEEIEACLARGELPVLVELENDFGLDLDRVLLIDHHGHRADSDLPTSLHQVFDLLRLPSGKWTWWHELVAANDRGYIPALLEIRATEDEIVKVRAADRAAQGISAAEEAAAEMAVTQARTFAAGLLTLVQIPHTRTAAVTDRLEPALGGPGYRNLLVISPEEVSFFGSGELVYALHKTFPGGWYGGALPTRGFWGHGEPMPDVLPFLLGYLRTQYAVPDQ